jgi:multidrug resistance efflux pump
VREAELLVSFDDVAVGSRYSVAQQALLTAEAELRQVEQQALNDARARAQLPGARGNVAERRAEVALLKTQKSRSQILAPQDGYVLFDDPVEWSGRPVTTGERLLRIAAPDDKEIEAWVAVGDAIPLAEGAHVQLHLSSSPMDPVAGRIRYVAYDAVKRADGVYAYRVRATLDGSTEHRIGLKGTVRLSGDAVPLGFWLVRRPLATIREFFGL